MTNFDELAQRYIDTWNETDPTALAKAVDQLYAADARYIDPLGAAQGRAAITATIAEVQRQFPGFRFRLLGPVDAHHDQARFRWELGPDEGEAPIIGFDVAIAADDGQLLSVYGWLDKVPTP